MDRMTKLTPVCTTLGMLSPEQARRLKEAGLSAYNHNLDTSREFYPSVGPPRELADPRSSPQGHTMSAWRRSKLFVTPESRSAREVS